MTNAAQLFSEARASGRGLLLLKARCTRRGTCFVHSIPPTCIHTPLKVWDAPVRSITFESYDMSPG